MQRASSTTFAAITLLFASTTAFGCSLAGPPPTAPALIAESDAIYLAVATRYAATTPQDMGTDATVQFQVLEVLKGSPRYRLELEGRLSDQDDFNDEPDVPRRWIRPEGRRGSCFAMSYRQGGTFLLLMRRGSPYWSALTPTNEQVTGPGDPWVAWVRKTLKTGGTSQSRRTSPATDH